MKYIYNIKCIKYIDQYNNFGPLILRSKGSIKFMKTLLMNRIFVLSAQGLQIYRGDFTPFQGGV